jgi:hypothetical protein
MKPTFTFLNGFILFALLTTTNLNAAYCKLLLNIDSNFIVLGKIEKDRRYTQGLIAFPSSRFSGEGWGITADGTNLYTSNGSDEISVWRPEGDATKFIGLKLIYLLRI